MAYVVVFGDFDQIVHCYLQLIASHSGEYQCIQLGCKLPHVLLICVHQTLWNRKTVVKAYDLKVRAQN